MTDLNPAIDAAAAALCVMVDQDEDGRHCDVHEQATGPDARFCGVGEYDATKAVQAAAPVLLARMREQVADEIETSVPPNIELRPNGTEDPVVASYVGGIRDAGRIARATK